MLKILKHAPMAYIKKAPFTKGEITFQKKATRLQDAVDTFINAKDLTPTHTVVARTKDASGETVSCMIEPINFIENFVNKIMNKKS